jgi:undecaprenyl diphosphate synthase
MNCREQIDKYKVPQHVAIIMDGNGRWAKQRGNSRIFGHQHGVGPVRSCIEAAAEIGIKYLTLYAFSTENWNRPKTEVDALMSLMVRVIKSETDELNKNNVRLKMTIGDKESLPKNVRNEIDKMTQLLSGNTGLTVVMALSYSSRWEIINAVKSIVGDVKKGKIEPDDISRELFHSYLSTAEIPDPELMIRTSGERQDLVIFYCGSWLMPNCISLQNCGPILPKRIFLRQFVIINNVNAVLAKPVSKSKNLNLK